MSLTFNIPVTPSDFKEISEKRKARKEEQEKMLHINYKTVVDDYLNVRACLLAIQSCTSDTMIHEIIKRHRIKGIS